MQALEYLCFLVVFGAAFAVWDRAWLKHIRPRITGRRTDPNEFIPTLALIGGIVSFFALLGLVPLVGWAAGF